MYGILSALPNRYPCFSTVKRKEESLDCAATRLGDSFFVLMDWHSLSAYRHYSICNLFFNIRSMKNGRVLRKVFQASELLDL